MTAALVLGGAECVWTDAETAMAMVDPDAVIAVNDMIALWPGKIDYACTLHREKLLGWQTGRKAAGFNADYQTAYFEKPKKRPTGPAPKVDLVVSDRWPHLDTGSSGLYGVKVALNEGFDRVILAGIPMDAGLGHFVRHETWDAARGFRAAWVGAIPHILGPVRSMSGWTREILGYPSQDWLAR